MLKSGSYVLNSGKGTRERINWQRDPLITRDLLDAACASYFLEETDSQGSEQ